MNKWKKNNAKEEGMQKYLMRPERIIMKRLGVSLNVCLGHGIGNPCFSVFKLFIIAGSLNQAFEEIVVFA